jgi:hypothetical protein
MARMSKLGITCGGLFLCLLSTLCWADGACADQMQTTKYTCVYGTCEDTILAFTPEGLGIGGQAYTGSSESCCEQLFTSCYFVNSDCDQIVLRNADVRERVNEVSRTSRILLADCKGHYALYEPHVGKASVKDHGLLDERVLR